MNIGSIVKIKRKLKTGKDYGDIHVFDGMEEYFGKSGFVTEYDPKENAVKVFDWWWSVSVVKPVRFLFKGVSK